MPPARPAPYLLFLTLVALATPSRAAGQDSRWSAEGELGASVFFCATSQTTVATRAADERADSTYALSVQGAFAYGEGTEASGEDYVAKRDWKVEASVDWHPYGRLSPFLFSTVESSLQRQIDVRFNGGAGGKLTLRRDERSRMDVSVAILGEETRFRSRVDGESTETRVRWSGRLRAEREVLDGRISLSTVNFYRPVVGEPGNFVFESQTGVGFRLSRVVTLKISLIDTYDSRAEERGAPSNNDGQLLFSVLSEF